MNYNTRLQPKALTVTLGETKVGKTLAELARVMELESHAKRVDETRRNYAQFDKYKAFIER